jgi:predicted metal-binding membrane protein
MSDARRSYLAKAPVIGAVVLLAAGCWAISAVRMDGMDAGPGGDLGATGWFMATWVGMMAAMMLPVVTPLAVRYQPVRQPRTPAAPVIQRAAFLGAYLAVWAIAGLFVYELISGARHLFGGTFAWTDGGRWIAVAVLGAAAGYQLTSRKRRALERCKQTSELGRRPGLAGLRAGVRCLWSSWAMMAALFALGVMSLWWMAVVAALIAAERLPRVSSPGRLAGAAVFLALALGVAISPASVPGLTVPGSPAANRAMMHMSSGPRMSGDAAGKGERSMR